ncbi:SRP receptor beta subunit [Ascosphaera apis ARSEF 7405]|uniref:Signal recognition particle receptor subunit beta n=1 Tax=Ascosphaera apis ARSEF 7405 TaxID=392613 RepID=A0A167V1U2_9EURO|nr:SRP receptor beta subunit [Ascosphaera apis ARSEF 7405]
MASPSPSPDSPSPSISDSLKAYPFHSFIAAHPSLFPLDNPRVLFTSLLAGHVAAIAIAALCCLLLPVLLHFYIFRASRRKGLDTFLLLGPMGAGKTTLVKTLEQQSQRTSSDPPKTHTSQTSSLTTIRLTQTIPLGSQFYRSKHDTSRLSEIHEYRLYDTPGHGKLRTDVALQTLAELALTGKEPVSLVRHVRDKVRARQSKDKFPLKGVIFMVDGASMTSENADTASDSPLTDAASYLHDVLSIVQARVYSDGKIDRKVDPLPVLLAVNKQDLFTSLPPHSVRKKLEAEIEKIRQTRLKAAAAGLAAIETLKTGDAASTQSYDDEVDEVLGGDEREPFTFEMLKENTGVEVTVIGGAVVDGEQQEREEKLDSKDADSSTTITTTTTTTGNAHGNGNYDGIKNWEKWIGQCM